VGVSPQAFVTAVESALGMNGSLPQADGSGSTGLAVFIDTYERLEPLDS